MNKAIYLKIFLFTFFFILVLGAHQLEFNDLLIDQADDIDHHEHSTVDFVPCAAM
jgi:hypothetical protein